MARVRPNRITISLSDEEYAMVKAISTALDQSYNQTITDLLAPVVENADFLNAQMKTVGGNKKSLENLEQKIERDIDALKGETLAMLRQARLQLNE
jgi:hypothetical protein